MLSQNKYLFETRDLKEFVNLIVLAATSQELNGKNKNGLIVEGSLREVYRDGLASSYQFEAIFDSGTTISKKSPLRVKYIEKRYFQHEHGEPKSDIAEYLENSLQEIKSTIYKSNKNLISEIEGEKLIIRYL